MPVYYGSYWPWGFGGLGFGSYYGSYYDRGFYDPYSPGTAAMVIRSRSTALRRYGYPYVGLQRIRGDGELRLKIKPREAQVFVDGYYVGIVDDFDGVFQRLHLESGPHRIEVRAPGYETLTFDVQIRFDETTKFEGDLRRIRKSQIVESFDWQTADGLIRRRSARRSMDPCPTGRRSW